MTPSPAYLCGEEEDEVGVVRGCRRAPAESVSIFFRRFFVFVCLCNIQCVCDTLVLCKSILSASAHLLSLSVSSSTNTVVNYAFSHFPNLPNGKWKCSLSVSSSTNTSLQSTAMPCFSLLNTQKKVCYFWTNCISQGL